MLGRRRDGTLARVAPYRRILPFLIPRRNDAMVLFDQQLDMSLTQPWLAAWNQRTGTHATVFHLVLHALGRVLHERPNLNRFVAGRRIYDRHGVFMTFAAKKSMRDDAPLATVKRPFPANESFAALVASLTTDIRIARSDALSKIDKELHLLFRLPAFLLSASIALLRWLDRHGLAPRALIDDDPMYTSVFIANLGSLQLAAAYHHLFEHGNCPLFCTVGAITPAPLVVGGAVEVRPTLPIRYTYDERIEDGFYAASAIASLRHRVEDPASWIDG
jgi:hypothetical protein